MRVEITHSHGWSVNKRSPSYDTYQIPGQSHVSVVAVWDLLLAWWGGGGGKGSRLLLLQLWRRRRLDLKRLHPQCIIQKEKETKEEEKRIFGF